MEKALNKTPLPLAMRQAELKRNEPDWKKKLLDAKEAFARRRKRIKSLQRPWE